MLPWSQPYSARPHAATPRTAPTPWRPAATSTTRAIRCMAESLCTSCHGMSSAAPSSPPPFYHPLYLCYPPPPRPARRRPSSTHRPGLHGVHLGWNNTPDSLGPPPGGGLTGRRALPAQTPGRRSCPLGNLLLRRGPLEHNHMPWVRSGLILAKGWQIGRLANWQHIGSLANTRQLHDHPHPSWCDAFYIYHLNSKPSSTSYHILMIDTTANCRFVYRVAHIRTPIPTNQSSPNGQHESSVRQTVHIFQTMIFSDSL